ncbi:MAG: polysaccharide deacetylase family protein [Actinobacteria bacterium]|nr:polysaccharide deacetylase family protein [Actinomycetota bacterium]MBU1942635.1 polysaccharide deacetylase family protein [Actinomycetota bacterium]MBU2688689.1 polysaccharide deacetylase family protein [Actinomycetota bacterium]
MHATRLTTAGLLLVALLLSLQPAAATAAWNGGHDTVGSTGPSRTWYFAEGTTRQGFSEYVCVFNQGSKVAVTEFSYMLSTGEEIVRRYDLAPESRTTINVAGEVPPASDVSVGIESSEPVVAERPMYFTYNGVYSGGTDVAGATSTGTAWYFAEGTTRDGFDTFLCIANPGDAEAMVDIEYFRGDGTTTRRSGVSVAPGSRFTVAVHEDDLGIGRHNDASGDTGIKVGATNGAGIVVERPVYFRYGTQVTGGTDVMGAGAPRRDWYFAEGCTRPGFDTYLCLFNPASKDARVRIEYMCADGQRVSREGIEVPGRSRRTVAVHEDDLGIGRHDGLHGDVSAKVSSENGVATVVERPTYFTYRPYWTGGHDVMGAAGPREAWFFAEGCTRPGFDTYLCLFNPGGERALVDLHYFCSGGLRVDRNAIEVEPGSRLTVPVHEDAMGTGRHDDNGGDVSILVQSSNGVGVIAERPMYFAGRWRTMNKAGVAGNWGWGQISRGSPSRNRVALTFDIEMSSGNAARELDILKSKDVKSTFFMLAAQANAPGLLERMADEGHELASHGVSHSMSYDAGRLVSELAAVESTVNQRTGLSTKPYFRFPGGAGTAGLIQVANSQGYMSVYWSVDPQDWSGKSAEAVVSNVLANSSNGSIILLHDRDNTVAALPAIIDGLCARGLEPVTLTEMLYPGP